MSKPIIDKAEVSIDFPDKFYHGSFGRSSRFDATVDEHGMHIALDRPGEEQRHVAFHLQHHLFGAILESIAEEITEKQPLPESHRQHLFEAAEKLVRALNK